MWLFICVKYFPARDACVWSFLALLNQGLLERLLLLETTWAPKRSRKRCPKTCFIDHVPRLKHVPSLKPRITGKKRPADTIRQSVEPETSDFNEISTKGENPRLQKEHFPRDLSKTCKLYPCFAPKKVRTSANGARIYAKKATFPALRAVDTRDLCRGLHAHTLDDATLPAFRALDTHDLRRELDSPHKV